MRLYKEMKRRTESSIIHPFVTFSPKQKKTSTISVTVIFFEAILTIECNVFPKLETEIDLSSF